ncbi:MAG: energy-coupling factor transport system ATP-binding protein [Candidatus Atribacteria bacterium]|jgi:energy-coupling factor transport system ATP-binding protein|uniref:Energy-coupling factor transporter ATPase n=1 Tax=Thermatribacter velox TaxID=3039681 RepID=A0ABZ2YCK1_9BACT|nr:energy-coupling factor transport system ATP-binding protein [Candidatus Atribacteria bacterium]MDI3530736.1 energy-coupling factor transport system ATP-binding protein [Candidatus Atribacteria bacterium]
MIEFREVSFWYAEEDQVFDNVREVLKDVNLTIKDGEFVVLLGRNGSGKSTLARHCNGLLIPKRGDVLVEGINTKDTELIWEVRQKVGLVFQNPDNQLIATTVEEDVAFGPENLGLPPHEIRKRVDEALEMVGMSDFKKREPHLLSGGQKQKVAIAGVLAMSPRYLVLDEATSMLDPEAREDLLNLLLKLKHSFTIFHITHYVEEAVEADRVLVMDEGTIVASGTPREVFAQIANLRKWGLEAPQITETALLIKQKVPRLFKKIPLKKEELVDELCSFV